MSTFGKLSSTKKDTIKEIIRYLIVNEYLMEVKIENSFGSVIKLNKKGEEWITSNKKLKKIEDKIYQMKLISQNNELVDLPDDFENPPKTIAEILDLIEKGLKE